MKKALRVLLTIVLILIGLVLFAVVGYLAYVLISYHRIEDQVPLSVSSNQQGNVETGKEYGIVSYNIGFGAYEADYDFFMDGGHESWAWSEERLTANLEKISRYLADQEADFYLIQEVDLDSTRSYHVDESEYLKDSLWGYGVTTAQNYDSPYLIYPFYQPHGASKSAIMTFSLYHIDSAERISLPVETSLYKLLDLDRCYSVHRIPTENGKELVLINLHLSAYTSDGTISDEQVHLVVNLMEEEYKKGNYVIAGGDFNKDLTGDPTNDFGTLQREDYSWAKPFPSAVLIGTDVSLVAPYDPALKVPSCRNPNAAWTYDNATQFVITVDGFLVSKNVSVLTSEVLNTDFAYSDHNPVRMTFVLED
ncbi:MAG: endonuclease/exonuclease/phosphatase family protein [Lachnospiraceae bacterium]|nr:endonuclease/exonuclease/phosphatase family protein [Lachnospiraceae bacterium]